ncbi:hypothetical protein POM88_023497 [Heracleum sosnowskyi]|uniref:CCHC-type domain-containing protein n=1 Tax=Heracleum sosnowskyi TaxID=360622 RepID=A0AAD8IH48_9APIA|nr:hypothetical protein POM88_023497 [Heracleum sosnowskyi]
MLHNVVLELRSLHSIMSYMGNISTAGQGIGLPESQVGQFGNQNVGYSVASTGTTTIYMRCSTCGQMGHISIKCPAAMDGQEHSLGGRFSRTISGYGSGNILLVLAVVASLIKFSNLLEMKFKGLIFFDKNTKEIIIKEIDIERKFEMYLSLLSLV